MANKRRLILASKSPRRKQLLSQLGLQATVMDVDIDETPGDKELPADYVRRVAEQKALAACKIINDDVNTKSKHGLNVAETVLILAADTCIVFERKLIGKPRDAEHGANILRRLSGNKHQVLSAVCLLETEGELHHQAYVRMNTTDVEFKHLSKAEISDYWRTGEPIDKAGGYAIQGLGATFIKSIHGSYSAVMGLPLFETAELLATCGVNVLEAP